MYNGVGVATPRGTGTSGHVQNNLAILNYDRKIKANVQKITSQKSDSLKDHEKRVKIESECYSLTKKLRAENVAEDVITKRVNDFRKSQMQIHFPSKKTEEKPEVPQ